MLPVTNALSSKAIPKMPTTDKNEPSNQSKWIFSSKVRTRTASLQTPIFLELVFLHKPHQPLHILHRSLRQNPMA